MLYDPPFGYAAIDAVLYRVVPDVLTCYRCEARLADCPAGWARRYRPFDLAIGERYRQERLRVEQLRGQRADSAASAK